MTRVSMTKSSKLRMMFQMIQMIMELKIDRNFPIDQNIRITKKSYMTKKITYDQIVHWWLESIKWPKISKWSYYAKIT